MRCFQDQMILKITDQDSHNFGCSARAITSGGTVFKPPVLVMGAIFYLLYFSKQFSDFIKHKYVPVKHTHNVLSGRRSRLNSIGSRQTHWARPLPYEHQCVSSHHSTYFQKLKKLKIKMKTNIERGFSVCNNQIIE